MSPPSSRHSLPPSIPPAARKSIRAARESVEAGVKRAIEAASTVAPRYFLTRGSFVDSVVDVDVRTETYDRLLTLVERRRLIVDFAPAKGARRKTGELHDLPDPARHDPFAADPKHIAEQTRVPCLCPHCDGSGHTKCRKCLGTGHVDCRFCRGTGRVDEKVCPTCQGAAVAPCPSCTSGRVRCATCEGGGRVFAWLRLEVQILERVTVEGDPGGIAAHANVRLPSDFEGGPGKWKNDLYFDSGLVPDIDGLDESLLPELDARTERVKSMRFQGFSSGVHAVRYATPLGSGAIEVAGNPPVVLPSSQKGPLRLRRNLLLALFASGVVLSVMVAYGRMSLHPWMREHGGASVLFALSLVGSLAGTVALGALLVAPKARRLVRILAPALVAVLFGGAAGAYSKVRRPSVDHAKALASGGDLRGAREELAAVIALGLDPAAKAADDELHRRELDRAPTVAEKVRVAELPFWDEAQKAEAAALVRTAAQTSLDEALPSAGPDALFALGDALRPIDPALALRAYDTGAQRRVADCLRTGELVCEFRGTELGEERREQLEADIEEARARSEIAKGDYDALAARLGRWTKPSLTARVAPVRDAALAKLDQTLRDERLAEARSTTPEERKRHVATQLAAVRSLVKLGRTKTDPPLDLLLRKDADLDRDLVQKAKAARPTWR